LAFEQFKLVCDEIPVVGQPLAKGPPIGAMALVQVMRRLGAEDAHESRVSSVAMSSGEKVNADDLEVVRARWWVRWGRIAAARRCRILLKLTGVHGFDPVRQCMIAGVK